MIMTRILGDFLTKVGMVSLGCSKNQVDAEKMMAGLVTQEFVLWDVPEECDVIIVNTCGFIEAAKEESIENILTFSKMKTSGKLKVLVVTGCLAERYQNQLAQELPEVDVVLGIGSNHTIGEAIGRGLRGEKVLEFAAKTDLSLEGERILSTPSHYAYLKVAEGCDNRCSYCAIPLIRGPFRSRTIENIVEEAKTLAAMGVVELNLIAQDTTRYGEDLYGKLALVDLLRELVKIEGIHWIRLLYCYPERITPELIAFVAEQEKVVKYFDIPLQHISDPILKRMSRRNTKAEAVELLERVRREISEVVIRTTFITGFPGETEEQFEELCQFVSDTRFERLGCFAYSVEEDTPAALMKEQLDEETKRRRMEVVMEIQMNLSHDAGRRLIGKELEVLVEGYDSEQKLFYGRSYMDAPDVDPVVYFKGSEHKSGDFVNVIIEDSSDYDLIGKVKE